MFLSSQPALLCFGQDSCSCCAVDVGTVWWEAAGGRELCVVTAGESAVSLWRPLAPDRWGKVHTWQLGEVRTQSLFGEYGATFLAQCISSQDRSLQSWVQGWFSRWHKFFTPSGSREHLALLREKAGSVCGLVLSAGIC